MKKVILSVLIVIGLFWGALIQISLLAPNPEQAQTMPHLLYLYNAGILLVTYLIVCVIDWMLKMNTWRYLAIFFQAGIIVYTLRMFFYYDNVQHNRDRSMEGYFAPDNLSYWIIAIFSLIIISYSLRLIKTPQLK